MQGEAECEAKAFDLSGSPYGVPSGATRRGKRRVRRR
jgi:hypothetical protein